MPPAFHPGLSADAVSRHSRDGRSILIAYGRVRRSPGANLMRCCASALGGCRRRHRRPRDAREGLESLFPIEELSIIGLAAVVKELPKILGLIKETAIAVTEAAPDILVIIDSPDFTHRVAKRVRAKDPRIPIVDYVSPSVWAWRPGRARAMLKYVDHVLALLPFEPEAYRRLHGPPCSYVGHPLTEQLASLRPNADEAARGGIARAAGAAGKRPGEIRPTGGVRPGGRGLRIRHSFELVLPTMPHLQNGRVCEDLAVQPRSLSASEKRAEFRIAQRAAKSGTVLELRWPLCDGDGLPAGTVEAWICAAHQVTREWPLGSARRHPDFCRNCKEKLAAAMRDV